MNVTSNDKEHACLQKTVAHFKEIARQNRFPENAGIPHDNASCVICHPELLPMDPFLIYLEVVTQSIKVRRPALNQELVDLINDDTALAGMDLHVTIESPLAGMDLHVTIESLRNPEPEALAHWVNWVREAIETALELLSIHSPTSREFTLDQLPSPDLEVVVEEKIREIINFQRNDSSH